MNYDLHIIDKNGDWEISVYKLYVDQYGHYLPDTTQTVMTIALTNEEATRLTLGLGQDEGGDRWNDADDFFVDMEDFFDTYQDIPERVSNLLRSLPENQLV